MRIDIIAGARPNFIKIAPIIKAINNANEKYNLSFRLIHTGQHYDSNMSGNFFKQLKIPKPDFNLKVGSGTQAEQTASIMIKYEKLLIEETTDICLVVGDVNSTMACAIVAKKMNIKVAHIEAGIRSYDLTMPEEINRMVTDSITDYFFTTSEIANKNLKKIGVSSNNIFFAGNIMIDTLLEQMPQFKKPSFYNSLNLISKKYFVLTLHRPSNVDNIDKLKEYLLTIDNNAKNYKVIFPIHPRTKKILDSFTIKLNNIYTVSPLSYLEFNYLVKNSFCVITDSGGITEETTVMGIPCMTLRDNTERPETIKQGTNELIGTNANNLIKYLNKLFSGSWKKGTIPRYWDGKTANRIVKNLINLS